MRLYFTDQPPQIETEMITVGHLTIGHMIIPPGVERFTVTGYCSQRCTETVRIYLHIVVYVHIANYALRMYIIHMHVLVNTQGDVRRYIQVQ